MTKIYKSILSLALLFAGVKGSAQVSAYSFTQLSGVYNAIPISGPTTTAIAVGNQDDNVYTGIPIGFNFNFNGSTYTSLALNVNGWISFGTPTPFSSYNPISSGSANDIVSFFSRDLQLGPAQSCTTTSGSNTIALTYPVAASNYFAVGDTVAGTGIPLNATISAISAGNLIISAPATAAGTNVAPKGYISYNISGVSPNMVFTIQWKRVGRYYYTTTGLDDYFNAQIKLYQTTNVIEVIYGSCGTNNTTSTTQEIGLRGLSTADFNNRSVLAAGAYATSAAGTVNSASAVFATATAPSNGQIYRWTPPLPCAGAPNAGSVSPSQTICPNTTAVVSNTSSNSFTGITYQWMQAPLASGPWTNVTTGSGFNTQVLTTASLTAQTFYQLVITCTNSAQSVTTAVTSVNPNNPATLCYCNTNLGGSGCSGDNITNVSILGTLFNNNSTCNSNAVNGTYTQFPPSPSTTATLNIGVTYSISVNTTASNIESVWIDYNQSGTFDISEHTQITLSSTANVPTIATFTVPGTALLGQTGMRVRSRGTGNPNGPGDACTSFGSGETEDYIVTIGAASACSGVPGANSAVASLTNACPNGSVTLSLATSYTVGGLAYQWYIATAAAGPYTLVTGATAAVYTATNVTTSLFYRAVITCTNSAGSTTSTPVQVTVSGNPCQCGAYCLTSAPSQTADDEIFNVNIGTLNNTSNCSQTGSAPTSTLSKYSNYTGIVAAPNLAAGVSYTLNVTVGQCNANAYSGGVTAYMDFNNNGSFADPGEQVYVSPSTLWAVTGTTNTGVVTIPTNASIGITRMRVIAAESNVGIGPCVAYGYGETEDYCINITAPTPCAGAPAANTALTTMTNVCPNGNVTLSLANSYTVGGLTYQWFSAPAVSGPYTPIATATTAAFTATNLTTTLFYQAVITCTNGPASTTSTPVQVVVSSDPCRCSAYCTSNATNALYDEILNVSIGSLNNTSNCNQTGSFPTSTLNLYSNYTGIVAAPNLAAGINYNFSVTVGMCNATFANSGIVTIYMDFNQNGLFTDPGELVYTSPYTSFAVTGTTLNGVIAIPASATSGITRMRVVEVESSTAQPDCGSYFAGETEDYCINITPATPCAGAPGANAVVATSTNVCPNASTSLSLTTTYTIGGLTYQWFSAPALSGPYTAISGATATAYSPTNIATTTFYQAVITCTNGPASTTATPVQIVVGGSPCQCSAYCLTSAPTQVADDEIFNVTIGTLNNTSNCSQTGSAPTSTLSKYSNYTGIIAAPNLAQNTTYTLDVTVGQCNATAYSGGVTVYMDFNSNGLFSDPGEQVYASPSTLWAVAGTLNSTVITIPASASLGITRMRVIAAESNVGILECASYGYGETEDYCINITGACATPTVVLSASQTTICNGASVNLTASGATTYTWNTTAQTSSISVTPSVTTTYTVVGENAPGCPDTKTISITVKPSPTLSVSVAPSATLCPGMTATLTGVSSAGNYTWAPGSQTTAAISVTPAISTVYNVVTTNTAGCSTNSNVTVFVVVCTGVAKSTVIDNNTFIYPNPNSGSINVVIENSNGSYVFEVHDLSGRVVYKTTLNKSESAVNIKELANGMYTYKITSLTTKVAIKEGKLIKE